MSEELVARVIQDKQKSIDKRIKKRKIIVNESELDSRQLEIVNKLKSGLAYWKVDVSSYLSEDDLSCELLIEKVYNADTSQYDYAAIIVHEKKDGSYVDEDIIKFERGSYFPELHRIVYLN